MSSSRTGRMLRHGLAVLCAVLSGSLAAGASGSPVAGPVVGASGPAVTATFAAVRETPGCQAVYISSRWAGGFTGGVKVTNLGPPLTGWRLEWDFADRGQRVTRGWNGVFAQEGGHVTVTGMWWNSGLATGDAVSPGFNGSLAGRNPDPVSFRLNGVACAGLAPPPAPGRWNPPKRLAGPLGQVWRHVESTYPDLYGARNRGWDQIMANRGSISYCVRWDSAAKVSAELRDRIHAALARQFGKWTDALTGWDSWPYEKVPVRVVGWAVRDRSALEWRDDSVEVHVNAAAECALACSRFSHQDGDYSGCPGGAARHYDLSLWLTSGFPGGAGGDWGQRLGSEYLVGALAEEDIPVLQHEIGHTFGLDDFYDWDPGVGGFLMKAGSAGRVTEFDRWMLRDWWRHLKSRYGY
ncbi:cellulose-binding domain-containing protein [Streptosporangium sp. KLBMP 9127]|nr:cellulose binding domain-containing protein [Streptosporangium sp. KLBMP 9127]